MQLDSVNLNGHVLTKEQLDALWKEFERVYPDRLERPPFVRWVWEEKMSIDRVLKPFEKTWDGVMSEQTLDIDAEVIPPKQLEAGGS